MHSVCLIWISYITISIFDPNSICSINDFLNIFRAVSYGVVNFPREDGYHRLEVETWSPMGDWQFSNFTFFLGT